MMTRREAIKTVALAAGAFTVAPCLLKGENPVSHVSTSPGPFKVQELGSPYDALEPYIDAETMRIHHDKHNAAYVDNLNKAIAEAPESLQKESVDELLLNLNRVPEKIRVAVRNNAGGQYNHSLFWKLLKKNEGGKPGGELAKAIDASFGSYPSFQDKFTQAAKTLFGSGWTWLVLDGKKLLITRTPNQDCPLSGAPQAQIPLLGIDLWERAYYLKYQNRRPEYVKAFWNVINWDYVTDRYSGASKVA